jgi:Spy/CpxP family protein refolding chaperone
VITPGLRAGLVIGAVVIASAIAGAAIDRSLMMHRPQMRPDGGRRGPPQALEQGRRNAMLDRMTKELSLTPAQHAALDSIFQRTDSSLRAIRRESQPRIQQIFERSTAEVNARLDPSQREKFAKMHPKGRPSRDGFRDGDGGRGMRPDSARQ